MSSFSLDANTLGGPLVAGIVLALLVAHILAAAYVLSRSNDKKEDRGVNQHSTGPRIYSGGGGTEPGDIEMQTFLGRGSGDPSTQMNGAAVESAQDREQRR